MFIITTTIMNIRTPVNAMPMVDVTLACVKVETTHTCSSHESSALKSVSPIIQWNTVSNA